jgi:ferredoxin
MAKLVVIDEQECDGCQTCVELCPDVFEFDEDAEVARVIDPEAEDACIEEAIDSCPAECISWQEE